MGDAICIAGVGAVGATLAARLLAAGESVVLHARGARLAQLRTEGLRVEFPDETLQFPVRVSDHPDVGVQDIVFLAAKSHALPALLPTIAPLIGPDTTIVPLVNGIPWWYFQDDGGCFEGHTILAVDPDGTLAKAFDTRRLVGSVLYMTARSLDTGTITVLGRQKIAVGALHPGSLARADRVAALLARAGIASSARSPIRNELWPKVALNLATNPLSVVSGATLVEQFTDARLLPLVTAVLEETLRVASTLGVEPSMSLEQMLATGRQAGRFETSMLQDYRAGRALELDAIAHAVLELAGKVGVQMPATRHIVNLCAHRADARPQPATEEFVCRQTA